MLPDARQDRADRHADRRDNGADDMTPCDWRMLGERIRGTAIAAATVHLIETAGGKDERVATLETSPDKPGG